MDIDNFDFRPLTGGLGFDKTTEETKKDLGPQTKAPEKLNTKETHVFDLKREVKMPNEAPVSRSLKKMLDSLPPSIDFKEDNKREQRFRAPEIHRPLKPEVPIVIPDTAFPKFENPSVEAREKFDITLDNSLSQAFPRAELNKTFYHQTVTPQLKFKEVTTSFASAVLDVLIVSALSTLFVVSLIAITQVDIINMISNHNMGMKVGMDLGLLFFGTSLLYYMISRGFFGSTLGDWAFDVQLGMEEDRMNIMYPFQVIFRTLIIILTGVIIVPILSVAFGKDMAYYFSGLKLYSRQY